MIVSTQNHHFTQRGLVCFRTLDKTTENNSTLTHSYTSFSHPRTLQMATIQVASLEKRTRCRAARKRNREQ
ncbi:hypothetical protein HBI56_080070 [Parastagonospora nodorum]|uniref:Uncharacterized protein n=1 Tax=Phaeosphaeria nodorum (strain SN15 / ATCC MYA-4574 / FGSC 10173) TaxID=321614 RepID=A0A7U2I672_PHANO|nr:hypothetical protein HBH56_106650 [Parastagonospora nodorum]QRD04851.1 hypothetical protein JI435_421850 [Parastagonospora nodorum SN15]KAH3929548.1 hypothetical protein HBH54_123770 [Parastagonospora nodorum]KAH3951606.1 hypothetical protein HBH53_057770 [Parastagonospora nodorum]KAH3975470.1 hypothetical protein HBH52_129110 [Parastagonospora nodorum]